MLLLVVQPFEHGHFPVRPPLNVEDFWLGGWDCICLALAWSWICLRKSERIWKYFMRSLACMMSAISMSKYLYNKSSLLEWMWEMSTMRLIFPFPTIRPRVSNRTKSNKKLIEHQSKDWCLIAFGNRTSNFVWVRLSNKSNKIEHNRTKSNSFKQNQTKLNAIAPNPVQFCSDYISWRLSLIEFDCQPFDNQTFDWVQ